MEEDTALSCRAVEDLGASPLSVPQGNLTGERVSTTVQTANRASSRIVAAVDAHGPSGLYRPALLDDVDEAATGEL